MQPNSGWVCPRCLEKYHDEDLLRIREPHGEVLIYTPCCEEGPLEYAELLEYERRIVDERY